jgi:hypothetical protein
MRNVDVIILKLLGLGRLQVDFGTGLVYAPRSNTPSKPIGTLTKKGYLRACINFKGHQVHAMVHRVVWVAANGAVPDGMQIDHRNTIKTDNHPDNLEAVPQPTNMARAAAAGLCRGNGRKDGIRDAKGRFGKKHAGRLLDGREWSEMPGRPSAEVTA